MVLATVTGSGNGGLGIAGDDGAQIRIAACYERDRSRR